MLSCARCGTVFTARLPRPGEATDYVGQQERGADVPAFVENRLAELVRSHEAYRRTGRWLDVGCGAGTLLRAAAECGWSAVGTEVAPGRVQRVRADGLEVYLGELRQLELPKSGFDVVSLVEVVEHLPDPDALLADAARLVRPGGAMYLTTPHGRGVSARLLGDRWSVAAPPEHLQLFSTRGLSAALSRQGLTVARLTTHAVNPHELVARVRRREVGSSSERKETAYRLNESLSGNRLGAAAKSVVNATLGVTRLGDTIKVTAERPA